MPSLVQVRRVVTDQVWMVLLNLLLVGQTSISQQEPGEAIDHPVFQKVSAATRAMHSFKITLARLQSALRLRRAWEEMARSSTLRERCQASHSYHQVLMWTCLRILHKLWIISEGVSAWEPPKKTTKTYIKWSITKEGTPRIRAITKALANLWPVATSGASTVNWGTTPVLYLLTWTSRSRATFRTNSRDLHATRALMHRHQLKKRGALLTKRWYLGQLSSEKVTTDTRVAYTDPDRKTELHPKPGNSVTYVLYRSER